MTIPPAGTSLAGFFVEERFVDETKPPGILADARDPRTGEFLSITLGFDPTDAAVLAALSIKRGSGAAVQDIGHRFRDLKILDKAAPGFIAAEVARALDPFVQSRQIKIRRVEPVIGHDWAEAHVEYYNAAQNDRRNPTVLVGS